MSPTLPSSSLPCSSVRRNSARLFSITLSTLFLILLLVAGPVAQAQQTAQAPPPPVQKQYKQERFVREEVMIPVRDGVKLQTVIFTPKEKTGPLPILLMRTPYGVPEDEKGLDSRFDDLIRDGYVFVFQNIRGRFKSGGQFI